MATEIENAILNAVDVIVNGAIANAQLDKTVTAIIQSCSNALTGEYKVAYNGGIMTAYVSDVEESYANNVAVYVLIPQGDMTQKKIIIGQASNKDNDNNITFVSSIINNYNKIGKNPLSYDTNTYKDGFGVRTFLNEDSIILYKKGRSSSQNYVSVNEEEFFNSVKKADGLMIEASFFTRIPEKHLVSKKGIYGLEFILAFEGEAENSVRPYIDTLPKITTYTYSSGLTSISGENSVALLKNILTSIDFDDSTKINWANGFLTKLSSKNTISKLGGTTTSQDIANNNIFITNVKNETTVERKLNKIKYYEELKNIPNKYFTYTLDSNHMSGNPFGYTSKYYENYLNFPIDKDKFLYIEQITFYCKDFIKKSEENSREMLLDAYKGKTIFVKDLEIYALQNISAVDGEFRLQLSMPDGGTLKSTLSSTSIRIIGRLTQQNTQDLSDMAQFYWFKKDTRIIPGKDGYNYLGGSGWYYYKDKGNQYTLTMSGADNRAYENNWLCVCVYNEEIILKQEFTIYNEAAKRELSIVSDLGNKFYFNLGKPTLTCLVDNYSENFERDKTSGKHPDNYFNFYWEREDNTTGEILTYNETISELQQKYNDMMKSGELSYQELIPIRSKIELLKDSEFEPGKNKIKTSLTDISGSATFRCSVFLRDTENGEEYNIGTSELTLENEGQVEESTYRIVFVNGDQVFQYDEYGISPTNESKKEPLKTLPVSMKFFDPNNQEIDKTNYNIFWRIPKTKTLLDNSGKNLSQDEEDPDNFGILSTEIFEPKLVKDFSYNAINNQAECVVKYEGLFYRAKTNFLFTKVGNNGTNGTEIVSRITVDTTETNYLPCLHYFQYDKTSYWNDGNSVNNHDLKLRTYLKGEEVAISSDFKNIKWSMSESDLYAKTMMVTKNGNNGRISYNGSGLPERTSGRYRSQIVKVSYDLNDQRHYAYYPLPVIEYTGSSKKNSKWCDVQIERNSPLEVIYNADGRNPFFNEEDYIKIVLRYKNGSYPNPYFTFSTSGGDTATYNASGKAVSWDIDKKGNPDINIVSSDDRNTPIASLSNTSGICYFLPVSEYSGEFTNNLIKVCIQKAKGNSQDQIIAYIPICMTLNTYGLASLNQWDGNHVSINEDEGYILSPQIGAGVKEKTNTFSGLVMGTKKLYGEKKPKVGMFGYSDGKQSLYIDAYTGKMELGLPGYNSESASQGGIILEPYGISKIGGWYLGKKWLFNIPEMLTRTAEEIDEDTSLTQEEKDEEKKGKTVNSINNKPFVTSQTINDLTGDAATITTINTKALPPYTDKSPGVEYPFSVPHNMQGVIISADPAYISLKGRILTKEDFKNGNEDQSNNANRVANIGDTFEIELNANSSSLFTVWRHYKENNTWKREKGAGIDNLGRFYSNAVKDPISSTTLTINYIGAYGKVVNNKIYRGLSVESDGNSICKLFTAINSETQMVGQTSRLYITGASSTKSEYQRPITIAGQDVRLYATSSDSTVDSTPHRIVLDNDGIIIQHYEPYTYSGEQKYSLNGIFIPSYDNSNNKEAYWRAVGKSLRLQVTERTSSDLKCTHGMYLNAGNTLTVSTLSSTKPASVSSTEYAESGNWSLSCGGNTNFSSVGKVNIKIGGNLIKNITGNTIKNSSGYKTEFYHGGPVRALGKTDVDIFCSKETKTSNSTSILEHSSKHIGRLLMYEHGTYGNSARLIAYKTNGTTDSAASEIWLSGKADSYCAFRSNVNGIEIAAGTSQGNIHTPNGESILIKASKGSGGDSKIPYLLLNGSSTGATSFTLNSHYGVVKSTNEALNYNNTKYGGILQNQTYFNTGFNLGGSNGVWSIVTAQGIWSKDEIYSEKKITSCGGLNITGGQTIIQYGTNQKTNPAVQIVGSTNVSEHCALEIVKGGFEEKAGGTFVSKLKSYGNIEAVGDIKSNNFKYITAGRLPYNGWGQGDSLTSIWDFLVELSNSIGTVYQTANSALTKANNAISIANGAQSSIDNVASRTHYHKFSVGGSTEKGVTTVGGSNGINSTIGVTGMPNYNS